jgi:hypothetical protein
MDHGIDFFEPAADVNEISTIDRVTVVATESYFFYFLHDIGPNLILEKFQRELPIKQTFGNFGPWASWTL